MARISAGDPWALSASRMSHTVRLYGRFRVIVHDEEGPLLLPQRRAMQDLFLPARGSRSVVGSSMTRLVPGSGPN